MEDIAATCAFVDGARPSKPDDVESRVEGEERSILSSCVEVKRWHVHVSLFATASTFLRGRFGDR